MDRKQAKPSRAKLMKKTKKQLIDQLRSTEEEVAKYRDERNLVSRELSKLKLALDNEKRRRAELEHEVDLNRALLLSVKKALTEALVAVVRTKVEARR